MPDLIITKKFLQKYHEHIKQLPVQENYKDLNMYEYDEDGKVKKDGDGNPIPKTTGATIVETINNKLSKDDIETWDESYFPFGE